MPNSEAGYSLVEVLVAILILAAAIIPMVGMFDAGLRAANSSGNYDEARALANANLELVKTMQFGDVKSLPDVDGDGQPDCPQKDTTGFFECSVASDYVRLGGPDNKTFESVPGPTGMIRVEVTVAWGSSQSFSMTGLVSE